MDNVVPCKYIDILIITIITTENTPMVQQPLVSQRLLIIEDSLSQTHHTQ